MIGPCGISRRHALILAWGLGPLWLASPRRAAPADLQTLVVGVNTISGPTGGILAARDFGFFREQGLEVDLVFLSGPVYAIPGLLGGRFDVVTGLSGPPVVNAVLAGGDLVWIGELLDTVAYTLVARPEIARPTDLRGKRVGVSRFGTSSDLVTRFMLTRSGLDPLQDVTLVQAGELSVRVAALAAGSIDATIIPFEAEAVARQLGLRELDTTARLGLHYPQEGIVVTRRFLRARPDTARRFLRAVVLGTHRYLASRPDGLALLRTYLGFKDDASVTATYDAYRQVMPHKPYVTLAGIQFVLDELAATNPRARSARPADFVDPRFVRELDESGFIDRLYGP